MKKVGLGLIGLGYVGKTHLRNCMKLKTAELVAVCDLSKKALSLAKEMGVKKIFRDYKQLLKDDRIDAVIVALPTYLHAEAAQEASEAGRDIFLEKPLARNYPEGKEIVSTTRKCGVRLMIGYPLRFSPIFYEIKKKITSGELGTIHTAYASMISEGPFFHRAESHTPHPVPSWWFNRELVGGGSLIDQGCHLINLLRWYFGEVDDLVESHLGYRYDLEVEDHATCILKFKSEVIAIINVGWYSMKNQTKVEAYGSVGHAIAHLRPSSKIISAIKLLAGVTPKFDLPHLLELQYFVNCVRNDNYPSPSGEDGLRDMKVISRAYENSGKFHSS